MPTPTDPRSPSRPPRKAWGWVKCANCLTPFERKYKNQKFCKHPCKWGYHNDNARLTRIKDKEIKNGKL